MYFIVVMDSHYILYLCYFGFHGLIFLKMVFFWITLLNLGNPLGIAS